MSRYVKLRVLAPHTQWGDKLFIADSLHDWRGTELTTTASTFPWWTVDMFIKNDTFHCKCFIQRGEERIWESFQDNRYVALAEDEVTINFNTQFWFCVVCEDFLTNAPVLCENSHAYHPDCFEPYFSTELAKNNITFTCMECKSGIRTETWEDTIPPLLKLRYDKVKTIIEGTCMECPNANCTYMIPCPDPTTTHSETVLKCPECQVEWCKFCEKQLAEGESLCSICVEGLRSVFQDIFDAIEEAAGTMCPECKYRGQKSLEECTHITCDCGAQFCYCCGVGKDDVDTADPTSSDINRLYGHNEEWEYNKDRCPMWLADFGQTYCNWPDDPYKSQKKFHQIKAQKKLIEVKSKTSDTHWNRVLQLDMGLNMQVEKFLRKTHAEY